MRIGQTGSSMLETACLVIETTVLVLRARSRLYPSQILQENMRWKALAEIYTVHSFAQLCNLNYSSKFCQNFCKILQNLRNSENLAKFLKIFANFGKILANF